MPFFTLIMQSFPVFQMCFSCNTLHFGCLQEVCYWCWLCCRKFPKLQRTSSFLSQHSSGRRDALEGLFLLLEGASRCCHGVSTSMTYQNKQPWLPSSWSGGSCVCAEILLQDEWLWALSRAGEQSTAKPWTSPVWCRTETVKGRQMGYEGEAALSPKLDLWWLWVLLRPSVAEQGSGELLEKEEMLYSKLYKYVETFPLNMPRSI